MIDADQAGKAILTAGRNTCVSVWDFPESSGINTFQVGANPVIRFDPHQPALLWVANAEETLCLWETTGGTRLAEVSISGDAPLTMDVARDTGVVVTCGVRALRFWQYDGGKLTECRETITHDEELHSVAISPDSSRVAAYDAAGRVVLWDGKTGRLLGTHEMGKTPSTVGGLVSFNADGSRLAAAGLHQTLWVFTTSDLELVKKLPGVAGADVTVLRWHPSDPDTVWFGDTDGQVRGTHVSDNSDTLGKRFSVATAGLAFDTQGERVAGVDDLGNIRIIDPNSMGKVIDRRLPRTSQDTPVGLDGHRQRNMGRLSKTAARCRRLLGANCRICQRKCSHNDVPR
ncbi:MAG: WD40 repeat domain-containing protein [Pirellulaceae bacterium]